jgi:hypothetical protein
LCPLSEERKVDATAVLTKWIEPDQEVAFAAVEGGTEDAEEDSLQRLVFADIGQVF